MSEFLFLFWRIFGTKVNFATQLIDKRYYNLKCVLNADIILTITRPKYTQSLDYCTIVSLSMSFAGVVSRIIW